MNLHNETAAPTAIGNGGGISNAVAAQICHNHSSSATEIAASIIAARFRIPPYIARLVCELAQIGGRLA
jgi:hypothetical protein